MVEDRRPPSRSLITAGVSDKLTKAKKLLALGDADKLESLSAVSNQSVTGDPNEISPKSIADNHWIGVLLGRDRVRNCFFYDREC